MKKAFTKISTKEIKKILKNRVIDMSIANHSIKMDADFMRKMLKSAKNVNIIFDSNKEGKKYDDKI